MFFFSSKNSFQGTTKEITETAFPFRMVALDMNGEPVQALAANESIILQFEPVGIPGNYSICYQTHYVCMKHVSKEQINGNRNPKWMQQNLLLAYNKTL